MNEISNQQQSIELLQQLGLKEYEARCFVALARLPKGTAKDISETSEVPRTRVYDAIRVLETKGLVEIQHSNPQQFRAVPIEEAAETLRQEYESRTDTLVETIADLEQGQTTSDEEISHEVWALSGVTSVANRTQQLIDAADKEIVLIIGHEDVITDELVAHLQAALDSGLNVLVGTATKQLHTKITETLPEAEVFVSELEWLHSSPLDLDDETTISRLLLVDQNTILVSSIHETETGGIDTEKAVFGRGFDNGIVVIARRLMATGLRPTDDPATTTRSADPEEVGEHHD
ncbi:TrmB family transcriptional regulator [Haladaptatus halobius]|uniref:TrmB family transcriptional regulator n=1 Tax=Haladaptatus halobius TaxID=2884875 RepID=UPI001D09BB20|nr:helix-turn-helix domain-containing protein [Haladaptatus halobius]